MATFDDLFGKKSKYPKWETEGETLIFVITGEPNTAAPIKDFKSGEKTFFVETTEPNPAKPGKNKYRIMTESQFDPAALEEKGLNFFARTRWEIPVRVVAKKDKDNNPVENWVAFETTWELSDNQRDRLKEAWMEDKSIPLGPGTIVADKVIDFTAKPRKHAIKMKAGE
jgi:hypothetical protein